MYTIKPENFSPPVALVHEFILRRGQRAVIGHRKIDEARHEGVMQGYHKGMGEALALFLTGMRAEKLAKWPSIPMVENYTCEKALGDLAAIHDELFGNLPAGTKRTSQEYKQTEDLFDEAIAETINNLVMPDNLAAEEFERHKEAVLSMKEEPLPEDLPWLTEILEERRRQAEQIAALVSPADLRRGRPIKDQLQT